MSKANNSWSAKRKVSAVVAGTLAGAMLLGGAYAWTDYSQTVTNRFTGVASNAVLLHDDFDGQNKDVYVENLGDSPIYVRVKFAEYLQIGNNSMLEHFSVADAKGDVEDTATWAVHQWDEDIFAVTTDGDSVAADTGKAVLAHTYYNWTLGDKTNGQKYYLEGVTESDANGRGGLTDNEWNEAITKYKRANCTEDHSQAAATACAVCGADSATVDTVVNLTSSVSTNINQTLPASDAMWLADYNEIVTKVAGKDTCKDNANHADTECGTCGYMTSMDDTVKTARWLLDSDGWAYWSQALQPHTATNLLLTSVKTSSDTPYDNWAYTIDVQLQASTPNQMAFWCRDNATDQSTDVANPDNSKMTATTNGKAFITAELNANGYTDAAQELTP